jgi:hypothetical protein
MNYLTRFILLCIFLFSSIQVKADDPRRTGGQQEPSEISQSDRDFINRVRAGEINKKDNPEEFTTERVKLLKEILQDIGADDKEIRELIPD